MYFYMEYENSVTNIIDTLKKLFQFSILGLYQNILNWLPTQTTPSLDYTGLGQLWASGHMHSNALQRTHTTPILEGYIDTSVLKT